jgi:hypothetical protein
MQDFSEEAWATALEILQIIELMERQNTGRINTNLTDSGVASAGSTIRNCMIARRSGSRRIFLPSAPATSIWPQHLTRSSILRCAKKHKMPAVHRLIL